MTVEGIGYINECLESIEIPYEFKEWTSSTIPDTYWVGDYIDVPIVNESGESESTFILTGTTKNKYLELETMKEQIEVMFPYYGRTDILENGNGIAITFTNAQPLPSVEVGVRRIQVNLNVKEYRGN